MESFNRKAEKTRQVIIAKLRKYSWGATNRFLDWFTTANMKLYIHFNFIQDKIRSNRICINDLYLFKNYCKVFINKEFDESIEEYLIRYNIAKKRVAAVYDRCYWMYNYKNMSTFWATLLIITSLYRRI